LPLQPGPILPCQPADDAIDFRLRSLPSFRLLHVHRIHLSERSREDAVLDHCHHPKSRSMLISRVSSPPTVPRSAASSSEICNYANLTPVPTAVRLVAADRAMDCRCTALAGSAADADGASDPAVRVAIVQLPK
jgi:hypothetical protein